MPYRSLADNLWQTADLVQRHMTTDRGLRHIQIEKPVDPGFEFRPTLSSWTSEFQAWCVEVSESIINPLIIDFVLDCKNKGFPALLSVAIPLADHYSGRDLRKAKESGIGVLEVNHETGKVTPMYSPLLLSLTGLTPIDKTRFPPNYRNALASAEETFRNGDAVNGCFAVYKEVEYLTRRIACKTHDRGFWKTPMRNPDKMSAKMPWMLVLEALRDNLDRGKAKANGMDLSGLSNQLLSRVIGVTPQRGQSAHKPKSLRERRERDAELRTRMEDAVNLLRKLIVASKCLRV